MTSTFHPVAVRTQSRKARLLRGVAQGAGGDHAHAVGRVRLGRAMKAPQHAQGVRHGLRIERAVGEDTLAQARDFAVFVQGFQAAAYDLGDFQPDRVGADIDRGKCGHARGQRRTKSIDESRSDYKGIDGFPRGEFQRRFTQCFTQL